MSTTLVNTNQQRKREHLRLDVCDLLNRHLRRVPEYRATNVWDGYRDFKAELFAMIGHTDADSFVVACRFYVEGAGI